MKIGSSEIGQLNTVQGVEINAKRVNRLSKTEKESGQTDFKREEQKKDNLSPEQVKKTVEELNKFSALSPTRLKFEVNGSIQDLRVKVLDEKGEVIREIPPEKAFEMLDKLQESTGTIIDYYV